MYQRSILKKTQTSNNLNVAVDCGGKHIMAQTISTYANVPIPIWNEAATEKKEKK